MTVNPHDAEEAMRPYLGNLFEAELSCRHVGAGSAGYRKALQRVIEAEDEALEAALELLGVQR